MRLEFLGGELLYAMRVITHGRFNLCPSPVCNPDEGDGACEIPAAEAPPVEFYPYHEVPHEAVETATRIVKAADWMSGESSIWKRRTAAACSTTSTRIPIYGRPWPRRSASIRSSASWIS